MNVELSERDEDTDKQERREGIKESKEKSVVTDQTKEQKRKEIRMKV
jgi:hypothetical protein